jgi:hypothetical protein
MNSSGRFSGDLTPATFSGAPVTLDAMGGWWDAGDYLKFVQTHSYLMAEMLVGVRDFPTRWVNRHNPGQSAFHRRSEVRSRLVAEYVGRHQ